MDKKVLTASSIASALMMLTGAATAQTAGVVNLAVSPTSANNTLTPRLTWSTNPAATGCTASGGWSGAKAASGAQTLTAIRATTNYTLTCTWGSGTATVNWTAPTTNTNGSALTNLARFRVLYGTSSSSFSQSASVDDPTRRSTSISSLTPGTWYFVVRAVNSNGAESDNSNVASKAVTGASAARTVTATVRQTTPTPSPTPTPTPTPTPAPAPTPVPPPSGTLRVIATPVYDAIQASNGTWSIRAVIGSIDLGSACDRNVTAGNSYYKIDRNIVRQNSTDPMSSTWMARCGT